MKNVPKVQNTPPEGRYPESIFVKRGREQARKKDSRSDDEINLDKYTTALE